MKVFQFRELEKQGVFWKTGSSPAGHFLAQARRGT
jgi:hypothetical protein